MFGSFFQRLKNLFVPQSIQATLAELEKRLVALIPDAVKAAKIDEPVYCLRIWYNGTDSPRDAVPWLMLVKESTRKEFVAKHGEKAREYMWQADEATNPGQAYNVYLNDAQLERLYAKWYRRLNAAEDEDEALQPFREMVQRVARQLNELDWRPLAPVTDDFVVFPADGAHVFMDDIGDLLASLPPAKLALLQAKELIPPVEEDEEMEPEEE